MRIAFFTDSYLPAINGVVTQIRIISRELAARGHEILILTPSQDSSYKEKKEGRIEELYLPSIALPTYTDYRVSMPHSSKAFALLEKFRPDIVHVHTPFGCGWLGIRAARKLGVPVIGTYHTLLPEFMMYLPIPLLKETELAKSLAWQYTNFFYSNCDLVTTPTDSMKRELRKNGLAKEVAVMPNAIDFALFNRGASRKKYSAKKPKLIYFGRVSYEKNIEVLIFALKHALWKKHPISLTITGSGPAVNYLREIAKEQKVSGHVHFHAPLGHEKLARHVASHDIFVTASTIETQGLTILEAMAAGLPCIGADCLAIPDSVRDWKNGFLFKPYDFLDLAKKIEKLVSSEKLRKKLGRNAVETAANYSLERIATQMERLYSETIAKKAGK